MDLIIIIAVICAITAGIIFSRSEYDACVEVNNVELQKCLNGEFGNYECSLFKNAEEICSHLR